MKRVFVSHSIQDIEVVGRVARAIADAGLDPWLDREEVRAGDAWQVRIVEAIDGSSAFALVLSPRSAALEDVRREIDLAQDAGLTVVTIVIEPVKIPASIRYQLAGAPLVDASALGFDTALAELTRLLREEADKAAKG